MGETEVDDVDGGGSGAVGDIMPGAGELGRDRSQEERARRGSTRASLKEKKA